MSGKGKGFESKTETEDSGDCGYLSGEVSGPISEPLSGPIGDQSSSDSSTATSATKHVDLSDRKTVLISDQQVDSGVIDYLSADLSNVDLSDSTPTEQVRAVPDLPPIDILFQQDEQGDIQLHIAAAHRCVKAISLLTRLCPDKSWLDIPNDDGQTALHLAVLTGDAVVVRMLVIEGASLAARDDWGRTPLHLATQIDSIPCIHALMTPVSGNPIDLDSTVNMWNSDGQTCVHVAAKSGNIKMMQVLVYYNADINAREGLCGRTALHIAAARGDAALARYLVESARASVAPRDYARRTPRRLARPHPALAAELRARAGDDTDTDTDTDDEVDSDTDSEDEEALLEALVRIRGSGNRVMQAV